MNDRQRKVRERRQELLHRVARTLTDDRRRLGDPRKHKLLHLLTWMDSYHIMLCDSVHRRRLADLDEFNRKPWFRLVLEAVARERGVWVAVPRAGESRRCLRWVREQ